MVHPYRSPPDPEIPSGPPGHDDCPDADIALVLLVTCAAASAHVVWAYGSRSFSGESELAAGTALVCLILLRPFLAWVLRRLARLLGARRSAH